MKRFANRKKKEREEKKDNMIKRIKMKDLHIKGKKERRRSKRRKNKKKMIKRKGIFQGYFDFQLLLFHFVLIIIR